MSSALSKKLAEFGVVESRLAFKFVGASVSSSLSKSPPYTVGENCTDKVEDDDNDGVENEIDRCPDTPSDSIVDENGCEIKISEKIEFYPNPTNGNVSLTLPTEIDIVSIRIFNINGKKLIDIFHTANKLSNEIKLDLSHYPTGIYFINLSSEKLKETIKLIKY